MSTNKLSNNLFRLRKNHGYTQQQVAKILNKSQQAYAKHEKGHTEIDIGSLEKLATLYNTTVDFIIGNSETKKTGVKVPVLGIIPAGVPIEAIENILDYEEIDSKLASTGTFFALKIKGDSMAPQILENDIVIIKQQTEFENNDTCVVIVNGYDATLKRVKQDDTGLWLIPNNSAHQSQFYPASDVVDLPVKIIGKAIEIRRSL